MAITISPKKSVSIAVGCTEAILNIPGVPNVIWISLI
jgi:hypothetical protein